MTLTSETTDRPGPIDTPAPDPTGNPPEIAAVVTEHYADVYRYAYRLAGTAADADDLTQQTFLIACDRLGTLREAAAVRGWLRTVCRREFLAAKRRSGRVSHRDEPPEIAVDPDDPAAAGRLDLDAVLADLPDPFRVAVVMHYLDGIPCRDIAAELGVPVGTVLSRLARARQRLWEAFEAAGNADHADPPAGDRSVDHSRDADPAEPNRR